MLKRRRRAADSSLTPLSRLLAVAMTLKPFSACTSVPSSGIGRVFSESSVMSASWTSVGMRVSSSIRATRPAAMARISGPGTRALSDGPSASNRA